MFNTKKIFGILLSGIMLISMVTISLAAVDKANIENITLKTENCNVYIDISTNGKFLYEYDKSIFEITSQTDGSTVKIMAKLKANVNVELTDMITIHIPDQEYETITVESKSAGVTIPMLNTNINVVNDKGAVGIKIPENFDKTVNYKATNASGSINFEEDIINYTLKMEVKNSSINLANYFPSYKNGSNHYEYKNGNGNAMINIDVKNSSFAIHKDK